MPADPLRDAAQAPTDEDLAELRRLHHVAHTEPVPWKANNAATVMSGILGRQLPAILDELVALRAALAAADTAPSYVLAWCPDCSIERCDAEMTADGLQHLDTCPNCGSTATPTTHVIQCAKCRDDATIPCECTTEPAELIDGIPEHLHTDIESEIHQHCGHDGQSDEANDWVTDLMSAIAPLISRALAAADGTTPTQPDEVLWSHRTRAYTDKAGSWVDGGHVDVPPDTWVELRRVVARPATE